MICKPYDAYYIEKVRGLESPLKHHVRSHGQLRVLSMGAGVQTTAMLILYGDGHTYDYIIFADTGNEPPEVYGYIEKYLKPHAEKMGIPWITVKNKWNVSLQEYLEGHGSIKPVIINRQCTRDFKIRPINRFLRSRGAHFKHPAIVDIGFSLDESDRLGPVSPDSPRYVVNNYPLMRDSITRERCKEIIREFGWPEPPKSSCDFCPYRGKRWFKRMSRENPKRLLSIISMEKTDKRYPKDTMLGRPLANMLDDQSLDSFTDIPTGKCDSGHCHL